MVNPLKKVAVRDKRHQTENSRLKPAIYRYLDKRLGKNNYERNKNHGNRYSREGRPDLEIIYKGKTYYFELKDPRGELSSAQLGTIARYEKLGITIHVITTLVEFKKIWEEKCEEVKIT